MADIALVWVKSQSEMYGRLPVSIVQEVSSYLYLPPALYFLTSKRMFRFETTLQRWIPLGNFSQPLVFPAYATYVPIGDNELFVSAAEIHGSQTKRHFGPCPGIASPMDFRPIPCNKRLPEKPGVCYIADLDCVYSFGGTKNDEATAETLCVSIKHKSWSWAPSMKAARSAFNPCLFRNLVYICGGRSTTAEVFNYKTSCFTLIPDLFLPIDARVSPAVSVIYRNSLTVLGFNYIVEWDLQRKSASTRRIREGFVGRSVCSPVFDRGCVYTVDGFEGICKVIRLADGVIVREFQRIDTSN